MKEIIKNWGPFFVVLLIFVLARVFFITPVSVSGHSMDPTLADGQKLMTLKSNQPARFDIVTTKEPDDLSRMAVKRVIGLPGETVEMKDDVLYINGKKVDEPYLTPYKTAFKKDKLQSEYAYDEDFQLEAQVASEFTDDFKFQVPEGQYFVLGDNRLISKDSRMFGFVDQSLLQGKVVWRYWPLNEMKVF